VSNSNFPPVTLPEKLLLLAVDPATGKPRCRARYLGYGVAGAALAELAARGRVAEQGKYISVISQQPTGDPLFDETLVLLPPPGGKAKSKSWLKSSAKAVTASCAKQLEGRGAIRVERHRTLGLVPSNRYHPAGADWFTPAVRQFQVSVKAAKAAKAGLTDPQDRLLAGFVSACGLARPLFPGLGEGRKIRKVLRTFAREQWPCSVVHRMVESDRNTTNAAVLSSINS
jgi:hypothetical protein